MPDESIDHLAVYGTLLRRYDTQRRLGVAGDLAYVGPCRFEGTLYDFGSYPGAVSGEDVVHGELYRIHEPDVLAVIDSFEGYDPRQPGLSHFVRRPVRLLEPQETAWVYFVNDDPGSRFKIPSGSWAEYRENRTDAS